MANEKRLIDANVIANGIANYLATNAYLNDTAGEALCMVGDWVSEAPTVDAVEVVRCKDCKHYTSWKSCLRRGLTHHNPEEFCCFGERRTDDERKAD